MAARSVHASAAVAHDIYARVIRKGHISDQAELFVSRLATVVIGAQDIELAEIQAVVREDAEREAIAALKDKSIQAIVDTYEVRRSYESELVGMAQ